MKFDKIKNNYAKRVECKDLNSHLLNTVVTVSGFIYEIRKLSKLWFIVLKDHSGACQIIIEKTCSFFEEQKDYFKLQNIFTFKGTLIKKQDSLPHDLIQYELTNLVSAQLVSKLVTPLPTPVNMFLTANERLKNQYRYLEMRNSEVQEILKLRHNLFYLIRKFWHEEDYFEVNTPILSAPNFEGAKEFIVPSNRQKRKFFALSQSPQIYKQLLMVANLGNYFQIAPCFRDEDLRSDRQYEFYQLDVETSFFNWNKFSERLQKMLILIWSKFKNSQNHINFQYLTYQDAITKYGCDKPDLRFNLFLKTLKNSGDENNFILRGIIFSDKLTNEMWNKLKSKIGKMHKANISYCEVFDDKDLKAKNVSKQIATRIIAENKIVNQSIIFAYDTLENVNASLSAVRSYLGNHFYDLTQVNDTFVWIVDWPLATLNDDHEFVLTRHIFTDLIDVPISDLKNVLHFSELYDKITQSYDLVINGYEVASGSVRINCPQKQKAMFKLLGWSDKFIDQQFGYFLQALSFGCPPHGGIAFGLERLLMILASKTSIRDVIPFSKNNLGIDALNNSPLTLDENILHEYDLKYNTKHEK